MLGSLFGLEYVPGCYFACIYMTLEFNRDVFVLDKILGELVECSTVAANMSPCCPAAMVRLVLVLSGGARSCVLGECL